MKRMTAQSHRFLSLLASGVVWLQVFGVAHVQANQAAFVMPETAKAAASQPAANTLPVFQNPAMSAGGETPEGWKGLEKNTNPRVLLARDTADFKIGPASLRFETAKGAEGVPLQGPLTMPEGPFVISGYSKAVGAFDEFKVAPPSSLR